jgi:hypothetical protein
MAQHGRRPPLNLLGGHSRPGAISVETLLVASILSTEIGGASGAA